MMRYTERMRKTLRCTVPALCALILPVSYAVHTPTTFAAPPATKQVAQTAVVGKAGDVSLRANGKRYASVSAAIFEPGWQQRGATFDTASGTARIVAQTAGSVIAVKPIVTADGKTLRVSVAFTADKDTPVNDLHVSINLPAGAYIGGGAVWNDKTMIIPVTAKDTRLLEGSNGRLVIFQKSGVGKITVAPENGNAILLQDNRVFSGSDLEIRVGFLTAHTLKAGATETVAFTVTVPESIAVVEEKPIMMTANADWIPLSPKTLDIVPGSALDFAPFLSDAPAGKYGKVIVRPDGHFGYEKRAAAQRFYGVNLCFTANYLEHAEADALATRLMRLGYNSVRIHHYEVYLIERGAADSLTFRADQLDKLDYLFAALKKRGLYIKTDLFVSRPVKPSEMGLTEGDIDDFKDAVLVSPPAMANWKAFSKQLLNHVNPYTKMAYKDDPALAWISVINEPNLTNGRLGAWKPDLRAMFEREWQTWYAKRYAGKIAPALPTSVLNDAMGRDVAAFLAFLHGRGYDDMSGFLRKEIGTKALLTYLNGWSETPAFMANRQAFDFVDNHFYWDHPSFLGASWGLPSKGWSGGGSPTAAGGAGPDAVAMTRLFGKPFTVSEWDYVYPNQYRAEGGLIMGAVSSLQNWDAIWRFAYSHGRDSVIAPRPADYFNMAQDPLRQASERVGLLLFLRGDVKQTSASNMSVANAAELVQPGDKLPTIKRNTDEIMQKQVGVLQIDSKAALKSDAKVTRISTSDGAKSLRQITVDRTAEQFAVNTPRTESVVLPEGGAWKTKVVAFGAKQAQATLSASSLDGKPLVISKRLLLTHLTDLQNSGATFATPDRIVLEKWGDLPYLVRRGSATVTITRPDAAKLKAWRLDTTGKRVAPLAVKATKTGATLELSTLAPDGSATLYYEVVAP